MILNILVFIVDDVLNIVYNYKVINKKMPDIINKGYILDRETFMKEFENTLKKEKVKSKFLGNNITIVKDAFYNSYDLYYFESLFHDLGFLKVNFLNIDLLFSNEDATFIEVNNSYMVLNLDKGIYLDLEYFNDIPKIIDYFSPFLKDSIILFGLNNYIPKIHIKNKKVYYYDNYQNYISESLLKVKKYGV